MTAEKPSKDSFVQICNTTIDSGGVHKLTKMGMFEVNNQHYHLLEFRSYKKQQRCHCK